MIAEKKIKGLYQSAKIRIPEVLCNTVAHYSFENTLNDICKSNLNKRISGLGSTRFNVMAICPINNWETQLLDELKDGNDYAHLDFGARGFFKNRTS